MTLKEMKIRVETFFLVAWLIITGVKCPTCRKIYHNPNEVKFILFGGGECFRCDHVRSDVMAMGREPELNGDSAEDFGYEESLDRFNMEDFGRGL